MFRIGLLRPAVVATFFSCAAAFGDVAQVTFETVPVGSAFGGSAGNTPGQVIPSLGQDGISVSVENFTTGASTMFFRAEAHAAGTDGMPTRHMWLDNIGLGFNFNEVGFAVSQVTIDYREFGGTNNVSVNGGTLIELPSLTGIPFNIAPGVTATADEDSITLIGPITSFLIGGQELAVDNIVAVPEPACLMLLGAGSIALLRKTRGFRRTGS